jgi:peptide chain release factor 1
VLHTINFSFLWEEIKNKILFLEDNLLFLKNDQRAAAEARREIAFLSNIISLQQELATKADALESLVQESKIIEDKEMLELLKQEEESLLCEYNERLAFFENKVFYTNDSAERSAFLEIRAGTGGQEASLFVADLARMYTMYGQKRGWDVSVSDASQTEVGGFREIVLHIQGKNVFEYLNFEGGVHRVQRVPATESAGRVHTSTVTIAVLPEMEEVEINIDPKDLRIDTYRASGAGGQHVNKTDSAVRITHLPTNLVVTCQDERSQHKNRSKAMKILQARLFALEKEKSDSALSQMRKDMVSSADRSEKIRTYNYPQNRVTDHRSNITLNQLDFIMNGDMDSLLSHLLQEAKKNKIVHPYLVPFFKK